MTGRVCALFCKQRLLFCARFIRLEISPKPGPVCLSFLPNFRGLQVLGAVWLLKSHIHDFGGWAHSRAAGQDSRFTSQFCRFPQGRCFHCAPVPAPPLASTAATCPDAGFKGQDPCTYSSLHRDNFCAVLHTALTVCRAEIWAEALVQEPNWLQVLVSCLAVSNLCCSFSRIHSFYYYLFFFNKRPYLQLSKYQLLPRSTFCRWRCTTALKRSIRGKKKASAGVKPLHVSLEQAFSLPY